MGPLAGFRFVEIAGIGPGPMCAMLLSDMGADVLRVDRPHDPGLGLPLDPRKNLLNRGRRSVAVDLKHPQGVETVLSLVERADGLIEGFRPGVTERIGIGPEDCFARNPRLVYGRVTGWGQEGPLAQAAGHDMNYIALVGVLNAIGPRDGAPSPPLNLVGDFGGGALYLAFGMVCAVLEAQRSGQGQVVDAAMIDGSASLATMFYGLRQLGRWGESRDANVLDGGAPYYAVYRTRDDKYISLAPIEQKFYDTLLDLLGLERAELPDRDDPAEWEALKQRIAGGIVTGTRDEWCERLEGSDACFAPVLSWDEAWEHPHNRARETFVELEGITQPGPSPRFSRTRPQVQGPPPAPGEHTADALADWGFDDARIEALTGAGAIR